MSSKGVGAVTGVQEQKGGLVPKLRFPEFRDAGGWRTVALKDVLRPTSREVAKPESIYTGLGLRSHGKGTFQKADQDPDKIAMDRLYVVHRDDLIVNITFAWEGAIAIANNSDHGLYVSHRFPTYEFKSGISSPDFFRYVITDKAFVYRLGVISPGGAGRNRVMNKNDFLRISTLLPSVSEQQKIADSLSSIDAVIAAEAEKQEALKDHKKGLMQQLFPAPGETTPRLRFPEFQEAGDWGTKRLGSSAKKVGSGITPKGGNAAYSLSGRPFLRSQNVGWGELLLENVAFITEKLHATFPATEIHAGDVLLNITGASIGRSAIADSRISGGNVNQHVCIIRLKEREMIPSYLNQFLLSPFGQSQIDSFQAGGNRQGLNFEQIRSFEVPCPPALCEQERIADCLSSIDALVAAQGSKIDALKAHKQGVMQQLFPVADQVQA